MFAKILPDNAQGNEKVLLNKLMHGDYKAFTTLYETYVREVTNYAFRFTSDAQIIEDSIHDIFVWLWHNRATLDIKYSLKSYLLKCIRTSILKKVSRDKKFVFLNEVEEDEDYSFFVSGEEKYIDQEADYLLKERVTEVLASLTSKQKEVVYLRFYHGLSFDEIAANMNLTTKACYKLMGRAINELRRSYQHALQD